MIIRVLDFETTGFPPKAGVCEVGWTDVVVEGGSVRVCDTVSYLCNPGLPIQEGAMKIHGITEEMVKDQPASGTVFRRLMEGADAFCAHNAEFEQNFFTGAEKPWLCTYKIALALYPSLPNHRNGTIPGHLGIGLDADRCEPLHRAGPDTYVTAMMLQRFLSDGHTVDDMIAITRSPRKVSRMPSAKGKYPNTPICDLPQSYLVWGSENYPIPEYRNAMQEELRARRAAQ